MKTPWHALTRSEIMLRKVFRRFPADHAVALRRWENSSSPSRWPPAALDTWCAASPCFRPPSASLKSSEPALTSAPQFCPADKEKRTSEAAPTIRSLFAAVRIRPSRTPSTRSAAFPPPRPPQLVADARMCDGTVHNRRRLTKTPAESRLRPRHNRSEDIDTARGHIAVRHVTLREGFPPADVSPVAPLQ